MVNRVIFERDEKKDSEGKTYIIDTVAYVVPESEEYPSGTKYSFQAFYKGSERLILRYDNADDANSPEAKHHKHLIEDGKKIIRPLNLKPENTEELFRLFNTWIDEVEKNVK